MLKVKCPAKINLTLEIINKRSDGFHNIKSIMQTINLFDILSIKINPSNETKINLSGTSNNIPYNEKNLVYKASELFLKELNAHYEVSIHIEKNIPISAGLAGGSTDAAGTIYGLNELFEKPFSRKTLHNLCSKLGSDLNFCLEGGCKLATGRGEILQDLPFRKFNVCLIKPQNLGISAKEAYDKFSKLKEKPNLNMTEKYINGDFKALHNDLEIALVEDYFELKKIKNIFPQAIMSGSGSTFFLTQKNLPSKPNGNFEIIENLESIPIGISKSEEG